MSSDNLIGAVPNQSTGYALQAAWFGAAVPEEILAPRPERAWPTILTESRPTCTKLVRDHLRRTSRPVTLLELHRATGCAYDEMGACLSKLRRTGEVAASERVGAATTGRVAKSGGAKARTYWLAGGVAVSARFPVMPDVVGRLVGRSIK